VRASEELLIVGGGPVGLAAALFVARQGRAPCVVEARPEPTVHSKALALNPRTLELLEASGVTQQLLELGAPIRGVQLHRDGSVLAAASFAGIHPRYPFMLALSQATTERVLARAAVAAGARIERGVKAIACGQVAGGVEVALERGAVGADGLPAREVVPCRHLLAADGAHSLLRRQLAVEFRGTELRSQWHLADAPLTTDLAADHAHLFLQPAGGFQFLVRVVDGAPAAPGCPALWRVLGNREDPLARLEQATPAAAAVWSSSFAVAHRLADPFARGHVYFAGDAAHVHSPVGARGLNLGLEDAWVFAELLRRERLPDYEHLRRPVDRRVVARVELVSRVVAAASWFHHLLRRVVFPAALKTPLVRARLVATVTGLDHPLPEFAASVAAPGQRPVS